MNRFILYILTLLLITACTEWNTHTYQVPADFTPYVDNFKTEAKKYGYDFDKKGLIVRFADLDNNIAGLAYYKRNPVIIEIDRTYWHDAGKTKNAHDIRENLIFHELGHGLLKRMHDNTVLANGDWKTIMCGDKLPNNRSPNINYRGFRKAYYIEELFTNTSDIPEWSIFSPENKEWQETTIINQDFSNSSEWTIGNNSLYESYLMDGKYVFTTKTEQAFYVLNKGAANTQDDFYFEARIRLTGNANSTYGLVCGSFKETNIPNSMHYFYKNQQKHFYIGESECLGPFIDLYIDDVNSNEYYTLAIRKDGNLLYYYLNGSFIYHNDLDEVITMYGNQLGFKIPGNSTLYVDYAEIRTINNVDIATKKRNINNNMAIGVEEIKIPRWKK